MYHVADVADDWTVDMYHEATQDSSWPDRHMSFDTSNTLWRHTGLNDLFPTKKYDLQCTQSCKCDIYLVMHSVWLGIIGNLIRTGTCLVCK
jgi:hypothetical protein